MSGPFGKIHNKNCCCGNLCPGCCMPVDELGNAVDIPFEINAPGCAIDGFTGVFNPLAVEGTGGACGLCGTWGYAANLDIAGSFWNFNGIDCDLLSGCTITFCMILSCQAESGVEDDPEDPSCCRRLRLYYASNYRFAGSSDNGGSGTCAGLNYDRYIGPTSCSCVDGLSAIFTIDVNPLTEENPDCGTVQPCVPSCTASGIEVII